MRAQTHLIGCSNNNPATSAGLGPRNPFDYAVSLYTTGMVLILCLAALWVNLLVDKFTRPANVLVGDQLILDGLVFVVTPIETLVIHRWHLPTRSNNRQRASRP